MYASHYGFTADPFHVTPDATMVYLTKDHREAIGALDYGLRLGKGFILITGEVGTGKTTVLRHSLRKLDAAKTAIVYVLQPSLTPRQLLTLVWRELAPSPQEANAAQLEDMGELVRYLLYRLQELHDEGKTIVIVIDEAQTMPVETLESLRLLSNLETDKEKFVQIILVGQPELEELLSRHELRQLNQRIAVRARINNLSPAESLAYLQFRMQRSAGRQVQPFSKSALDYIVQKSGGNPRRLNIFSDNALINGLGYGVNIVDRDIAADAIEPHVIAAVARGEKPSRGGISPQTRTMALGVFAMIGIGFIVGIGLQMIQGDRPGPAPAARSASLSKPGAGIEPAVPTVDAAYQAKEAARSPAAQQPHLIAASWTAKDGDTLPAICAKAYGICTRDMVKVLAQANPALDPKTLTAGQLVTLPVIENLKPVIR